MKNYFLFIVFLLHFFLLQSHAQDTVKKEAIMIAVSDTYSSFPPMIPRLLIKQDSIEKFLDDPACTINKNEMYCDFENRKSELLNCNTNLLQNIPTELLYESSNNNRRLNNDGGGTILTITFNDGSYNNFEVFFLEKGESNEIQKFLEKLNIVLNSELTCQ